MPYMQYIIPAGTSVVRWVKDNDRMSYIGWGIETTKLVTYGEHEIAPEWKHCEFCRTYSWEPDNYWTFYLPDVVRPWRFITVSKRRVKVISL